MKLVATSTLAFLASTLSAQSIETLIGQLVSKIYSVDGDTHKINISPYWTAEYIITENSLVGEGIYGNGNGVITFSENVEWSGSGFKFELQEKGQVKSLPFNSFGFYPEDIQNDEYEGKYSYSFYLDEGLTMSQEGSINGVAISNSISLTLDSITMQKKKLLAEISFNRNTQYPDSINDFYKNWMLPVGTEDLELNFNAKTACSTNPLDKACSAKAVITGTKDGNDVGNLVAKYSTQAKKAQFEIKHNDKQLFWLGLLGIKDGGFTKQVFSLKYKLNGGSAVLVFQAFGCTCAAEKAAALFFAPFAAFFGNFRTFDEAVHAVAYFDKVAATWDNKLFNVYPIIAATKFESDLLRDYVLDGATFQEFAEFWTNELADSALAYGQLAGDYVGFGRFHVNEITGPTGKAKFDTWFANLA